MCLFVTELRRLLIRAACEPLTRCGLSLFCPVLQAVFPLSCALVRTKRKSLMMSSSPTFSLAAHVSGVTSTKLRPHPRSWRQMPASASHSLTVLLGLRSILSWFCIWREVGVRFTLVARFPVATQSRHRCWRHHSFRAPSAYSYWMKLQQRGRSGPGKERNRRDRSVSRNGPATRTCSRVRRCGRAAQQSKWDLSSERCWENRHADAGNKT